MNKVDILKKSLLAQELNDEQLDEVARIGAEEVFDVGATLAKQGRSLNKLYLIVDGLVGLYLELGPITHRQLQAASNCEFVGWSSMMPPHRSRTTAKAIEKTSVLTFDSTELTQLCQGNPMIGYKIYRVLASIIAARLGNAFIQLMGVTTQDEF
jgi:CRP-like cAMP-binding protein